MTTAAQVRKAAAALEGVTESGNKKSPRWEVERRAFLWVGAGIVHARLATADAQQFAGDHPTADVADGDDGSSKTVSIALDAINGMQSNWLVRTAWSAAAPADTTAPEPSTPVVAGSVGDLPKSLGTPATRALVEAGVRNLSDVEDWSDEQLLALHGLGPKAVKILREAAPPNRR